MVTSYRTFCSNSESRTSTSRSQTVYLHVIGDIVAFIVVVDAGQFRIHGMTYAASISATFYLRDKAIFVAEVALPPAAARYYFCNEK